MSYSGSAEHILTKAAFDYSQCCHDSAALPKEIRVSSSTILNKIRELKRFLLVVEQGRHQLFWIERLDVLVFLPGAEEEDRPPGHVGNRNRRATRGVDIRFRQDRAVDFGSVVELLGSHHGVLPADSLVNEQRHIGVTNE